MGEKKLYRVQEGAKIAGVCGGIAEYFEIDPTLIRILAVVLLLGYGVSLWCYILAAIIIPRK